ncbi:MAG: 16S rRNA (cytosine(1402)-N(4))-methyltransferase [Deltaproteobacteria bacterium RIFCSPHIGHO2_12_FULL_43_9]|nr:MAG: 16S rRNA (cytosine(1402)-N(4))-methyltransferase [Deltaproteobacteria bacterium RIFCSPHIGHO2_12_FULL_43_9]
MHIPVLVSEVLGYLRPENGGWFFDGTLGDGGHSEALIRGGAKGVIATDRDLEALESTISRLKDLPVHAFHGTFDKVNEVSGQCPGVKFSGIILDLGLSSRQIANGDRGFSFQTDGPLDMRMDKSVGKITAKDIVNAWPESDLSYIFSEYGEERFSKRIAREIVQSRSITPITSTKVLAAIVYNAVPSSLRHGKIHPATRTFQALRIAVNEELLLLRIGLKEMLPLLELGGRVAVISFHSLEDRIVKEAFREWEKEGFGKRINKKPVIATEEEVSRNIRARSAKLRIFERTHETAPSKKCITCQQDSV